MNWNQQYFVIRMNQISKMKAIEAKLTIRFFPYLILSQFVKLFKLTEIVEQAQDVFLVIHVTLK